MKDQGNGTDAGMQQALDLLARRRVRFSIETEGPYGGATFTLTAEETMLYLADEDAALAACWKVTKEQYRDCRDEEFMQHCSAHTKKGRRCGNLVSGTNRLTPLEWVKAQGSYCTRHEGELD